MSWGDDPVCCNVTLRWMVTFTFVWLVSVLGVVKVTPS